MEASAIVTISFISIGVVGGIYMLDKHIKIQKEERSMYVKEEIKKFNERWNECKKNREKINFITRFIDEIPELSYYEAKQLQNKLGKIYLEWNDE